MPTKPLSRALQRANQAKREKSLEQHELFAQAYVALRNGTQAAIAAGYGEKCAAVQSSRMLKTTAVASRIAELEAALLTKHNMTADSVMRQLASIVHFDIRKLFDESGQLKPLADLDDDTAFALSSVEVDNGYSGEGQEKQPLVTTKIKMFDKNTAIANAMKHFKLLGDDQKNVGNTTIVFAKEFKQLL